MACLSPVFIFYSTAYLEEEASAACIKFICIELDEKNPEEKDNEGESEESRTETELEID
jgi:hypothetical protein